MNFGKDRQNIIKTLKETDFPKDVIVEVTGRCNLKCIMCPHKDMTRSQGDMSMETFKKIADEVAQHKKSRMWLAIMGEPLLHPKIIDMIRYAKERGIYLCLNTNGTLLDRSTRLRLLDSRPDEILIGVDASSKETYEKIRIGARFKTLISNTSSLLVIRTGSTPKVIVQFIVMEENKGEEEEAKTFWLAQGAIVKIRPKLGWRVGNTFGLDTEEERYPCPWLINACSIQWSGKFNQCDGGWDGSYSPGDITKQSISEVWNGELKERRARHWAGDFSHPLCKDCKDWMVPKSKFYYPRRGK